MPLSLPLNFRHWFSISVPISECTHIFFTEQVKKSALESLIMTRVSQEELKSWTEHLYREIRSHLHEAIDWPTVERLVQDSRQWCTRQQMEQHVDQRLQDFSEFVSKLSDGVRHIRQSHSLSSSTSSVSNSFANAALPMPPPPIAAAVPRSAYDLNLNAAKPPPPPPPPVSAVQRKSSDAAWDLAFAMHSARPGDMSGVSSTLGFAADHSLALAAAQASATTAPSTAAADAGPAGGPRGPLDRSRTVTKLPSPAPSISSSSSFSSDTSASTSRAEKTRK